MSVLTQTSQNTGTTDRPAGSELGAETRVTVGVPGWNTFVDEIEFVPELSWPQSINTYQRMRSDSQIEALHVGTVQPVREFRWSIDPNGAPASLVEQASADLGLPIRGHEDDSIARGPRLFDFDQFLDDALLAPLYGHFHFEIVGDVAPDAWHMLKLAPRHPSTIQEFQTNQVGELEAIRQNIPGAGSQGWARLAPLIPGSKLLPFIWRREAGSQVGRSMLRSVYREWMVKDRVIRIAAINLERAGGVPVAVGSNGMSDKQLADLATMARQFKVAEGGGGAVPFGTDLKLVGGSVPDAISLLNYCDEAMARVWALMLVQLGATATGNRALGGEFAIYAARAQRAMAKWVCRSVNAFLDQYTEWNLGPSASHAPLLHYEQAKPDALSLADMVALIEAGALTVDPELQEWIRSESGLPPAPPPPTDPNLGDLSPEEVALVQNSRNPPALPAAPAGPDGLPQKVPLPSSVNEPTVQQPTFAAADPLLSGQTVALPTRTLRRQPNPHEIAARIDLNQLDTQHQNITTTLQQAFLQQVIPGQVTAIGEQITAHDTVTRTRMAGLTAPVDGQDVIGQYLLQAAKDGATGAAAELAAQGVTAGIPSDTELAARVKDVASSVATMAANGLSLAAQRKGSQIAGGTLAPTDARAQLETHLNGMKQQWTFDQLQGAVTTAQNAGRIGVFTTATQATLSYYSSEILDVSTCDACASIDGTEYASLADAEQDYPSGGYVDCAGGPRCRGTLVAVSSDEVQDA